MRELLVATTNRGKREEILKGLEGLPFEILTLMDVDGGDEVEETGTTLEENAVLKAKVYGARTGKLTLSDDTGLEIDALNGEPGVKTARYSPGTAEDKYNHILTLLQDVPDGKRHAVFRAVIAIYDPQKDFLRTVKGECDGTIAKIPEKGGGYGYDPIFQLSESGKMLSELPVDQRPDTHRGRALAKAREILLADFS